VTKYLGFFIHGNLTAEIYENMLQDEIVPTIQIIVEQNFNDVWFQQDGTSAYYVLRAQ